MKTRALRWWSRAALDEAARIVGDGWSDWCVHWNVASGAVSAANAFEGAEFDEATPDWQPLDGADGTVWWAMAGASATAGIRDMLFGAARPRAAAEPRAPSMADEIAASAIADLQQALSRAVATATRATEAVATAPLAQATLEGPPSAKPWSGELRIRLESPQHRGVHIDLLIAAPCAEHLLRATTGARPSVVPHEALAAPLVHARDAVRAQPLRLRAELSGVTLDLGTLQSLRIGDVLPLPHLLDDALHLHTSPGAIAGARLRVGSAHLGSRDGQRAVELIHTPVQA